MRVVTKNQNRQVCCVFVWNPEGRKSNKRARAPRGETRPPEASRRAGYSTLCAHSTWSLTARMYGKISTFPKEVDDVAEWLQAIGLVRIILPCRAQCYGKSHVLSPPLSLPPSLSLSLSLPFLAQPQYKQAFADAVVEPAQLRELTDTKLRELVTVEGHRRRLVRSSPRAQMQMHACVCPPHAPHPRSCRCSLSTLLLRR